MSFYFILQVALEHYFCLSGNALISFSLLKDNLAGYRIAGWQGLFLTFWEYWPLPFTSEVSVEKSTLVDGPLSAESLLLCFFKVISLFFSFESLILLCLVSLGIYCGSLGIHLTWNLLSLFRYLSSCISSNLGHFLPLFRVFFSAHFSFSSPSGLPQCICWCLYTLVFHRSLQLCSLFFILCLTFLRLNNFYYAILKFSVCSDLPLITFG